MFMVYYNEIYLILFYKMTWSHVDISGNEPLSRRQEFAQRLSLVSI